MQPSNIDSRVARRRQPRVACVSVRDPLRTRSRLPLRGLASVRWSFHYRRCRAAEGGLARTGSLLGDVMIFSMVDWGAGKYEITAVELEPVA